MENKRTIDLPSSRQFIVTFIEGDAVCNYYPSLSEILTDDGSEWKYAVQDRFDEVLDLKTGDRLGLSFNRDNQDDSTGFIKRICGVKER